MDAMTLTKKHLQERIDLENLQRTELEKLDTRQKMESLEAKGKYFENKRQEQRQKLLDNHKGELSELSDMHEKEWRQFRQVKEIIRDSEQLSFELQPAKPQKNLSFDKGMEKPISTFQKLKKRILQRLKGKNHEPEM